MKKNVFSVSQINSYIHRIFESDYALKHIFIKGEISNCSYHSSGHIYFTLKDEKSQLKAVMFSSDRQSGLSFRLEDGQMVIVGGNVSVYERSGNYQLYARQIELSGAGELYLRYEQLKEDLSKKGYFDFDRKKPIPPYPSRIGVVTAATGAAIRDIESVARRRNPYVQFYLYPAKVQGEGAASEIASGIRFFDSFGVDIIIIGRGGGSIEDLWAFNEPLLADAIYEARTPIISGTGHEIDMTIADYCADLRAPTPSAACELAVPDIETILYKMTSCLDAMSLQMERRIQKHSDKVQSVRHRIEGLRPDKKLLERVMLLKEMMTRMDHAMTKRLENYDRTYRIMVERLGTLSPTQRLKGGYTFAQDDRGGPIDRADKLKEGHPFTLVFSDSRARILPQSVEVTKNKGE